LIPRSTVAVFLATLCVSAPGWSQSLAAVAPESHVSQPDGLQRTAEALARPAFRLDRSEEDWSVLCLAARRDDRWDPIKCLGPTEGPWFVSFGGELRSSYEFYRNYNWGSGLQDHNGYYLNRLMGHADLHLGARVRLFAEFQSGIEVGRTGGPRRFVDEDKLDLSQAFIELNLSSSVSLNVDSFFLWRQGIADGLYSQSGAFLRPAGPSRARYVGATQDVSIQWRLDAHTTVQFLAAYYEVGAYLRESSPPAKNAVFYTLTANYKF
jgi:hypothetical protein